MSTQKPTDPPVTPMTAMFEALGKRGADWESDQARREAAAKLCEHGITAVQLDTLTAGELQEMNFNIGDKKRIMFGGADEMAHRPAKTRKTVDTVPRVELARGYVTEQVHLKAEELLAAGHTTLQRARNAGLTAELDVWAEEVSSEQEKQTQLALDDQGVTRSEQSIEQLKKPWPAKEVLNILNNRVKNVAKTSGADKAASGPTDKGKGKRTTDNKPPAAAAAAAGEPAAGAEAAAADKNGTPKTGDGDKHEHVHQDHMQSSTPFTTGHGSSCNSNKTMDAAGDTARIGLLRQLVAQNPADPAMQAALAAAQAACVAATKCVVMKPDPDAPRMDVDQQQLFKGDKVQLLTANGKVAALAEVMMTSSKETLDAVEEGKVKDGHVGIGNITKMDEKGASSITFWVANAGKGIYVGKTTFWSKRDVMNSGVVTSVPSSRLRKQKQ